MEVSFSIERNFFDRPAVKQAMDAATHKSLFKAGSYVRKRARSSIRRRKKPSPPGSPPSAHATSEPSLKTILYAWDPQSRSVVVGPVKLNQVQYTTAGARVSVPKIHEFGGSVEIREWQFDATDRITLEMLQRFPSMWKFTREWSRRDLRWRNTARKRKWTLSDLKVKTRTRVANYPKRPFMAPALEAERPNFPELFADSIRGA